MCSTVSVKGGQFCSLGVHQLRTRGSKNAKPCILYLGCIRLMEVDVRFDHVHG